MRRRVLAGVVLLLVLNSTSAQAQFIGGASFNGTDSLVATWSGKGSAASVQFAALAKVNPPALQNLFGVVQLVLGSSSACAWVMPDYRWTLIPNTEAHADGLCQVLFYRTFQAKEHRPYRFRWFIPLAYDIRTYVISNMSAWTWLPATAVSARRLTAKGVTTNEVGDYLMAFYANPGFLDLDAALEHGDRCQERLRLQRSCELSESGHASMGLS